MDERYLEKRKGIEQFFIPENRITDSGERVISPLGRYELETYRYSTGPKSWNYSRGIVKRLSENKIIADVKRNYGHFWHTWVEHANGNEYLLCGEDYQGYSVINLTEETYDVFFPESGYRGFGFCWVKVHPSPDGLVLAVDGCYWACPYEIVFFDFSNPSVLPLPEIERCDGVTDPVIGWTDNDTFAFTVSYDVRKSDGVKYQNLSAEEQDVLDKDLSQLGDVTERFEWKRFDR
ncbi:MAG TPA: hypothetical protein PLH19_04600 [Anaerolineae bacterium]|nr:hypothetical protein [Anaerolineae bacterium]HQH37802.1 hypothetical protein [Anaerolineae bacterium]